MPVRTGCYATHEEPDAAGVLRLHLAGGGPQALGVDHVLAASGYRLNLGTLALLNPGLREQVRRVPGSAAPVRLLRVDVPGLHFTGSLAAVTLDPVMCFVARGAHEASALPGTPSTRTDQPARRHSSFGGPWPDGLPGRRLLAA